MPELTRLRCGFKGFDQLGLALSGCPKLETLHADLSHVLVPGRSELMQAAISRIHAHLSTLHTITVLHITETSYWFINELFHCPEVKHLFLGYDLIPTSRACDGLAILNDLRDSTMRTRLVFSDNETAFVYAVNKHDRTRTILLRRHRGNHLSDICGIHVVSVTSLVFHSDSWFRDTEDKLPVFPRVRKVTITDPSMFAVLIDLAESKSSTTRPCPELQDLVLAGKSDSKPVNILYSGAVRLIRALKGDNAIIRTLRVGPGIVLRGDADAEFDGIVHQMRWDSNPA
ncbi:hypothetical protein EXIGLDRAFT_833060 [Exidia glandulosa HHB12029]|uniref:F-box domain-containing protein n=1 Tax=Exidia glandulosa HHB12029 TaxID=1314781 RepID=A0A165L1K4_EXIGL|nr:hypothetical protein EXIGLDRAFT_833060 [Exidia glandulosa HHB12029]